MSKLIDLERIRTIIEDALSVSVQFRNQFELENYIDELMLVQDGVCALTGLRMLFDDDDGDPELRCSLDRIDSNGHYERGNSRLSAIANRWKGPASLPPPLRASWDSGSVVDSCVSLDRFWPWKFTVAERTRDPESG
jgi:hypothetical protein